MMNFIAAKVKAAVLNVTDVELKVLEATNEQAWGPHGSAMADIARDAENPDNYNQIMGILHQRLQERGENWRLCYKALLVLDYLCKQGPQRVAPDLLRSVHILESLRDMFEYKDEKGKDQGVNVRQRAKEIVMLINSPQRLQEEREKAIRNAGKYKGVSADDMRHGGGISGGGGYSSGGFGASGGFSSSQSQSKGYGNNGGGGYGSSSTGFGNNGGSSYGIAGAGSGGSGMGGGYGGAGTVDEYVDKSNPFGPSGYEQPKSGVDPEDPFEATRKRIERLKAEGSLPDLPRDPAPIEISGTLIDPPNSDAKKAPKKLRDVKVDPKFISTISSLASQQQQQQGRATAQLFAGIAPPPSARATVSATPSQSSQPPQVSTSFPAASLAPPPSASTKAAPSPPPAAAPDIFDLLGVEIMQSTASVPPTASAVSAAASFNDPFAQVFPALNPVPSSTTSAVGLPPLPMPSNDPFAVLAAAPVSKTSTPSVPPASSSAMRPALDDFFSAPGSHSTSNGMSAPSVMSQAPPTRGLPYSAAMPTMMTGSQTSGAGLMKPTIPAPPTKAADPFAGLGF
ncbi:hypothetical protein CEUSTIGMA_g6871.t1 [Chlamydomonas eustigma]|uniref:ENTH domain-containing protein n=1 Tax=Chlamydomonas eustigma TaxID=1157962 RepID=A0A250X9H7_9CHLO|nr:hypothetical protein CEUSTIGMA_g6871.t1 [Chlamydomonas eustigma]|eukprot:GAX79430.1 hypothetical protein CEUSTIGMA_g6871.t1 [Chlamydomonas eustigma]